MQRCPPQGAGTGASGGGLCLGRELKRPGTRMAGTCPQPWRFPGQESGTHVAVLYATPWMSHMSPNEAFATENVLEGASWTQLWSFICSRRNSNLRVTLQTAKFVSQI